MCRGHQAAAQQALQPEMGSNVGSHSCLFQHLTEAVFMSPGSQTSIEAGALHLKLRGSHCFPTKFSPLPDRSRSHTSWKSRGWVPRGQGHGHVMAGRTAGPPFPISPWQPLRTWRDKVTLLHGLPGTCPVPAQSRQRPQRPSLPGTQESTVGLRGRPHPAPLGVQGRFSGLCGGWSSWP